MAEVLGIVGSVIGIAQLTSAVITTGTKLSGILKDMQDIPDEISIRIEQLHMLSSSLQQSDCAGITTKAESFPPLYNARQHCQKCLLELAKLLEELTKKLERSGRARKKICLARHTLQKDQLTKIERRLSHSVDLLTVAHQIYMIQLLESQRLGLVNEAPLGMTAPIIGMAAEKWPSVDGHEARSGLRMDRITNSTVEPAALQLSFRQIEHGQRPKSTWEFGFAWVTGAVQLEFYQSSSANTSEATVASISEESWDKKTESLLSGVPKARIKISLPTWWSGKVIEALVYRSQVGWSQLLRTWSIMDPSYDCCTKALRNIMDGDLGALVKQFDQRQVTPWDELPCGWNLFSFALGYGQWQICSFLLDCGVEPYLDVSLASIYSHVPRLKLRVEDVVVAACFNSWSGDQRLHAYQQLIEKTDQNEPLFMSLLIHWKGPLVSFTNIRRSLWPDEEYYSEKLLTKRMQLTTGLALNGPVVWKENTDIIPMTRFALEPNGNWTKASIDLSISTNDGETLLHGLAGIIGLLGNGDAVSEWLQLSVDVVGRCHGLKDLCQASARSNPPHLETPLLRLIKQSFEPRKPFCCQLGDRDSMPKLIRRCEASISLWLECLYLAGVDLLRYGQEEFQRHVTVRDIGRDFGLKFSCHGEKRHTWWAIIHLIKFEFGTCPSQWKFWWSEISDDFAGDFWHMVGEQEISSLRVPGAWVEDVITR